VNWLAWFWGINWAISTGASGWFAWQWHQQRRINHNLRRINMTYRERVAGPGRPPAGHDRSAPEHDAACRYCRSVTTAGLDEISRRWAPGSRASRILGGEDRR
jgi:hypothetical protein